MSASVYRSSEMTLLLLLLNLFLEVLGEEEGEGSVPRAQHSLILYHFAVFCTSFVNGPSTLNGLGTSAPLCIGLWAYLMECFRKSSCYCPHMWAKPP